MKKKKRVAESLINEKLRGEGGMWVFGDEKTCKLQMLIIKTC